MTTREDTDASATPISIVSFTIFKSGLEPDKISQILGLIPDHAHLEGEYPKNRTNNPDSSPYKHGMWSLDSKLAHEEPFFTHLESLLAILIPRQAQIFQLSQDNDIHFYCTLFAQQGFELPPNLMRQIASLGAALAVTLYS